MNRKVECIFHTSSNYSCLEYGLAVLEYLPYPPITLSKLRSRDLTSSAFSIPSLSLTILSNPLENRVHTPLVCGTSSVIDASPCFSCRGCTAAEQGWELPLCIGTSHSRLAGQLCTAVVKAVAEGYSLHSPYLLSVPGQNELCPC